MVLDGFNGTHGVVAKCDDGVNSASLMGRTVGAAGEGRYWVRNRRVLEPTSAFRLIPHGEPEA